MKAKTLLICALLCAFIVMSAHSKVFAQDAGVPAAVTFSQQELDQMLAPIALYPDSLLAQILIAATYPDQVMDANQWVHAHPGLKGEELNASLDRMDWDLSIKALVPFPQVLDMMAQEPDWTQRLGEAFLAQQAAVMRSVQRLRRRAEAAGNLQSTPQQRVVTTDDYVRIEPVDPELVYIPRYNPLVVYGTWWWPAYPPFTYYPVWSGPPVAFAPVVGVFGFWGGITVGPAWGWGWGHWGWGSHTVFLNVDRRININTRNAATIHRWHNHFRIANVHNMAVAGRIGSGAVRMRAFGTRAANPAALHGHITSGRFSHGRFVTTGGGRPGMSRRGFTGSHSGFREQGLRGARPSASQVMRELRGGGAARGASRGSVTRGSSRGASRGSFTRGTSRGTSRGSFTRGTSRGASRGSVTRNASRSSFTRRTSRSTSQGGYTRGAARGGQRGGFRGAPRGASRGGQHGGGHNDRRR